MTYHGSVTAFHEKPWDAHGIAMNLNATPWHCNKPLWHAMTGTGYFLDYHELLHDLSWLCHGSWPVVAVSLATMAMPWRHH